MRHPHHTLLLPLLLLLAHPAVAQEPEPAATEQAETPAAEQPGAAKEAATDEAAPAAPTVDPAAAPAVAFWEAHIARMDGNDPKALDDFAPDATLALLTLTSAGELIEREMPFATAREFGFFDGLLAVRAADDERYAYDRVRVAGVDGGGWRITADASSSASCVTGDGAYTAQLAPTEAGSWALTKDTLLTLQDMRCTPDLERAAALVAHTAKRFEPSEIEKGLELRAVEAKDAALTWVYGTKLTEKGWAKQGPLMESAMAAMACMEAPSRQVRHHGGAVSFKVLGKKDVVLLDRVIADGDCL